MPRLPVPYFRLVDTIDLEASLDGEPIWIRVELFQDAESPEQFRCRTWRAGAYELANPGGVDPETGETASTTEAVLVPWQVPGGIVSDDPFFASSKEAALEAVLADLDAYLTAVRLVEQAEGAEPEVATPSLWPPPG